MIKNRLSRYKEIYIDYIDPNAEILILAAKTGLAAIIALLLFEYFTNDTTAVWAAFASYFIVQTDINIKEKGRVLFLLGVVIIFAILAAYGCFIGHYSKWAFSLSMFILALLGGWLNHYSFKLWNAAIWGLVIFLFAGSIAWQTFQPIEIAVIFLIGGFIAFLLCMTTTPPTLMQQFSAELAKTNYKLGMLLKDILTGGHDQHHFEKQIMTGISNQQLLATRLNKTQFIDTALMQFYKLFVLCESLAVSVKRLPHRFEYYDLLLQKIILSLTTQLEEISQCLHGPLQPKNFITNEKWEGYQAEFEKLRATLLKDSKDFNALMRYSDCFFKVKQLGTEINKFNQMINKLNEHLQ